jgi:hypothetical protein
VNPRTAAISNAPNNPPTALRRRGGVIAAVARRHDR